MFRKAAKHRGKMVELEFTDNGGAIHRVERILDVHGYRLKYSGLNHIKNHRDAEFIPDRIGNLEA